MKTLLEIEADVRAMASRIAVPVCLLPTFGKSQDGGRPHVEVGGGAYQYVVVERGCELERRRTPDDGTLLYWVFADVTHQMAFDHELRHRVAHQDSRRIAFAMQVELLARLDPAFADRRRREIAKILAKAPYNDAP